MKSIKKLLAVFIVVLSLITMVSLGMACNPPSTPPATNPVMISLDKTELDLTVFEETTLKATVANSTKKVEWETSDSKVVKVVNGKVTALQVGTATIFATVENVSASCQVTVAPINGTLDVFVEYIDLIMYVNTSEQLSPCVLMNGTTELSGGSFSYHSSDAEIVSVTNDGLLAANKVGQATITINGQIGTRTLEPYTMTVTVTEDVKVLTNVELNETIYMSQGRNSGNPFATVYTVAPTVFVGDAEVTDAKIELFTDNSDIANVDGMNVVGVSAGIVDITIKVTTTNGTVDTEKFTITVAKPYATVAPISELILETEGGKDKADLSYLNLAQNDSIVKIFANDTLVESYEVYGDMLAISEGAPLGEDMEIVIETEQEILYTTMTFVTFNVTEASDMEAFASNTLTKRSEDRKYNAYVIMTADVDYNGGTYKPQYDTWFTGTFNGRGHTFHNVVIYRGAIVNMVAKDAVVKNVAVINFTTRDDDQSFFATLVHGLVDNVFFMGDVGNTSVQGLAQGLIYAVDASNNERDGKATNIIAVIKNNKLTTRPAISTYVEGLMQNVHVVIDNHNGNVIEKVQGKKGKAIDVDAYETIDALKSAQINGFDTSENGYWTVHNEMLVFKTAVQYMEETKTFTKSVDEIVASKTATFALDGAITWSVSNTEVASVENGVVSVKPLTPANTKFYVYATYESADWGTVKVGKEVNVIAAPQIVLYTNVDDDVILYTAAGAGEYPTTFTPQPTVEIYGVIKQDAVFEYDSSNQDVAVVDGNGVVIAVGPGEATITITYDNGEGLTDTKTFIVKVAKTERKVNPTSELILEVGAARGSVSSAAVSADIAYLGINANDIQSVKVNGTELTNYTLNGTTLTIKDGAVLGENLKVKFETSTEIVETTLTFVTMDIKDANDMEVFRLMQFYSSGTTSYAANSIYGGYFIMTADVNMNGGNFIGQYNTSFGGTFNGRGHTIHNFINKRGLVANLANGGVLKNVALVNFTQMDDTGVGMFMTNVLGTVQNVYISGDVSSATGTTAKHYGLFFNIHKYSDGSRNGNVTNFVANIQNNKRTNYPAIANTLNGTLTNVHVMIDNHNGAKWNYSNNDPLAMASAKNVEVFANASAYATAIADETVDISAFDMSESGYWGIYNGTLMFKTAAKVLGYAN